MVGGEIDDRAVVGLVRKTRRVLEEAELGLVVPLGARPRNALELALIEDDVAFGDDLVGRLVNRHLVGLKSVDADARVHVLLIDDDARVFGAADGASASPHIEFFRRLHPAFNLGGPFRADRRRVLLQWVDVRRVGDRVRHLAIYGVGRLLRARGRGESEREHRRQTKSAEQFWRQV